MLPAGRMMIHELTTEECREVLSRVGLGRLACARGGQPYIVPVFFYFDETWNSLFSFSMVGQKIDWMRENPKVCIEVDDVSNEQRWTTVLIYGRYHEIGDSRREVEARQKAHELFQRRQGWWLPAAGKLSGGEEHHSPVIYRIRIDRMTGRRATRGEARAEGA
jgi:nitroimidazol reductase NimA-like FMN-containing flavoprotein (pyridoxamine 5'-phosphate oxidase superfamily)